MKPSILRYGNPIFPNRCFAVITFMLCTLIATSAHAAVVNLTFTGTYDTYGTTVFGLSGSAVPYSYQLTYDTSLDTSAEFYAVGANIGLQTAVHEWHGYSASGITALEVSFGTQTWGIADLVPARLTTHIVADMWLDASLEEEAPTLGRIQFKQGPAELQVGRTMLGWGDAYLYPMSGIDFRDFENGNFARAWGKYMQLEASPVPLPPAVALFIPALLGLMGFARKREG